MRDLTFYVEAAIKNSGVTSDRKLAALMNMSPNVVSFWRSRKVLPSDEVMVRLAQVGGIDPFIALLDLNMWRSEGAAKTTYKKMLEKITAAICGLIILGAAGKSEAAVDASTLTKPDIYIITSKMREVIAAIIGRLWKKSQEIKRFFTAPAYRDGLTYSCN